MEQTSRWLDGFRPDSLPGFENRTLVLKGEDDGELCATLVRKQRTSEKRPGILYLHGFVDYFFQTHLAEACEQAGLAFYALDLRRHGRSLRPGNRANFSPSVDDYFEEIAQALLVLEQEQGRIAGVLAHSTGALPAILYAKRGERRDLIVRLALNSPFFAFRLTGPDAVQFYLVKRLGELAPALRVPKSLNPVYGQTIHKSHQGTWEYDLSLKPFRGFPFYAGWFSAIDRAQREVANTRLNIPVLVACSSASRVPGTEVTPEDFEADTVLEPDDMKRIGKTLSHDVRIVTVDGGLHDLVLSSDRPRAHALGALTSFLASGVR